MKKLCSKTCFYHAVVPDHKTLFFNMYPFYKYGTLLYLGVLVLFYHACDVNLGSTGTQSHTRT